MNILELKQGDEIVFLHNDLDGLYEEEIYDSGYVTYVDSKNKIVSVCFLNGYSSINLEIPFEKVVAKSDIENGSMMTFGNIIGKSVLIKKE